jgi:hypothetical protein
LRGGVGKARRKREHSSRAVALASRNSRSGSESGLGRCTLTARWRVTESGAKDQPKSEQGTFIETSTAKTDAAEALALTATIDQLAGQIALTLQASR